MKRLLESTVLLLCLAAAPGNAHADVAPPEEQDPGCECSVGSPRGPGGSSLLALGVVAGAILLRQRRRAREE